MKSKLFKTIYVGHRTVHLIKKVKAMMNIISPVNPPSTNKSTDIESCSTLFEEEEANMEYIIFVRTTIRLVSLTNPIIWCTCNKKHTVNFLCLSLVTFNIKHPTISSPASPSADAGDSSGQYGCSLHSDAQTDVWR